MKVRGVVLWRVTPSVPWMWHLADLDTAWAYPFGLFTDTVYGTLAALGRAVRMDEETAWGPRLLMNG